MLPTILSRGGMPAAALFAGMSPESAHTVCTPFLATSASAMPSFTCRLSAVTCREGLPRRARLAIKRTTAMSSIHVKPEVARDRRNWGGCMGSNDSNGMNRNAAVGSMHRYPRSSHGTTDLPEAGPEDSGHQDADLEGRPEGAHRRDDRRRPRRVFSRERPAGDHAAQAQGPEEVTSAGAGALAMDAPLHPRFRPRHVRPSACRGAA